MAGFEMQEWIDRKPEAVFEALYDPALATEVMESVIASEQIGEGAVGVGTCFRETRVVNGQEGTSELEVVAYEPNHRYSVTNETEGIRTTYHFYLTPERDGTRIKLEAEVSAENLLRKMMVPVVVGILKKEDSDHLARLKDYLEGAQAAV